MPGSETITSRYYRPPRRRYQC